MKAVLVALISLIAVSASAQQYSGIFQGLSNDELAVLRQAKPLIRQAASAHRLSLTATGAFPDEIRRQISNLDANYIGEVLMVVQDNDAGTVLKKIAGDLGNVEGYVGIPYYSRQNKTTYDLFDKITVVERTAQPAGQTVTADQHMKPFGDYRARYTYQLDGDGLRFHSENLSAISYRGYDAVGPGHMVWYLYGFQEDKTTFLYGVGAVKAFDMLGIFGERLKVSFMGRIQAFFSYIYSKREGTGGNG